MLPPLLFSKLDMFQVVENRKNALQNAVVSADNDSHRTDDEIVDLFVSRFDLRVPTLDESQTSVSEEETDFDVSRDPHRFFTRPGPFYVKGTKLTVHVPFTGERDFFFVRPSTFNLSPPRAEIGSKELQLIFQYANDSTPSDLKGAIQRQVREIGEYLTRLNQMAEQFRLELPGIARQTWQRRKAELDAKSRLIADLGFPQKQGTNDSDPSTLAQRKQIGIKRPPTEVEVPRLNCQLFLSHASEDKESVARPLADALIEAGYSVWFDDYTLRVGDSLRQSIDQGLAKCKFGIVILSKSFFGRHWPQQELNGLASREVNGQKVILPVWHEIAVEEVSRESPILADRLGVSTSRGIDYVLGRLIDAMK